MTEELHFIANTVSAVKEITHDGKSYLVAPVVAIREGVLNGYLVPADEFGAYAAAWNGRPVSLGHPQRNGEYISANDPDVWALEVPGLLWNVTLDGDRLLGEIWIDLEKAEKIGERAMAVVNALRAGEQVEVSTGYFADLEETTGNFKGKRYFGIHRNIRPDHLALLPDEIGACSWEDGCGTPRVNSQKGGRVGVKVNEMDLNDRAVMVRRAFWEKVYRESDEGGMTGDWDVVAIFDKTLIAKDWTSQGHAAFAYTIADEGAVVTFGDVTPVEVVYRAKDGGAEIVVVNQDAPVASNEVSLFARMKQWVTAGKVEGIAVHQQEEKDVKKCDLVAVLAANSRVKFAREKLESWSEEDLLSLLGTLATNEETATTIVASPAAESVIPPAVVQLPPEVTGFATMIQELGGLEKLGQALGNITANADAEKNGLVADLVANEQCQFDEADLKAMSTGQLRKLAGSLLVRDYSGAAGVFQNISREEEQVMAMPKPNWVVAKESN